MHELETARRVEHCAVHRASGEQKLLGDFVRHTKGVTVLRESFRPGNKPGERRRHKPVRLDICNLVPCDIAVLEGERQPPHDLQVSHHGNGTVRVHQR